MFQCIGEYRGKQNIPSTFMHSSLERGHVNLILIPGLAADIKYHTKYVLLIIKIYNFY